MKTIMQTINPESFQDEELQEACRMPCAADCEKDMEDVPQVPDSIRPLLMLSGCCPSTLAQLLEEGDIVYAAE